jgi:uncharacterized glyoxalase superfamily protein PhnB
MSRSVAPMIHVPDVTATVRWYESIGFLVRDTYGDGGDGLSFAIMSYGASEVMFNSGGRTSDERRREVDLYVTCDDVDAVHREVDGRVEIIEPPHDTFYGMREVIVRDPNGFWITFGMDT